jgi:AcrR family transcriptional regulator
MPREISTPQERREHHRQEMIKDILDISRVIMREHGAAALNLHEIARQMGIKTPSLYAYFPSKMAIYDALFRLGTRLLRERMDEAMNEDIPIWDRLRAALEAYMSFAQENPELYQVVFAGAALGLKPSEEGRAESLTALETGRSHFAQAIGSGEIELGLPLAAAHDLMMALIHGLTALHMVNEAHVPPGSGRFGSLIPAAVKLLQTAWQSGDSTSPSKRRESPTKRSPFVWEAD